ncbi:MAG: hypothetical protein LBU84_18845 [Prevotella sp.]|jgi:hypothetical protein|nr:hypothetical protein [Prevotella sp.]
MIDHNKTYIWGLLVGGGKINEETFSITLPFDKWGMDPNKMNEIATDILTKISDKFNESYGIRIRYDINNKKWTIKPIGIPNLVNLKQDLDSYGLPSSGELIYTVDLFTVKDKFQDRLLAESFLSGIFDTRASVTASHRRFNDEAPVVSIEIPGSTKNFKFVVQLCAWLTSLGSITDQILYNHPCQHSPSNPNYNNWKKGFKIRFLVRSFLAKYSFVLQAKAYDANTLKRRQVKEEQKPCLDRIIEHASPVSIHKDINSDSLPIEVRNCLFFHYLHICATMGCPYAPIGEVQKLVRKYRTLISIFPRLEKGDYVIINDEFEKIKDKYYSDSNINEIVMSVKQFLSQERFENYTSKESGVAYLFSPNLNGNRHVGSQDAIIESAQNKVIHVFIPNLIEDAPLLLVNPENERAAIISNIEGMFNQKLIDEKIEVEGLKVRIK